MNIGIDQISFYIPKYYLDLAILAERNHVDVNKYYKGIGQEKMSIPPHDEDIVTLAANAAYPIIQKNGASDIDTILFATESSIDQSKAAAIYIHHLLNLPQNCRCVELKQACYSATAALQLACAYIALHPQKKVLLIASDISRYDLDSVAEVTQGCGAVAMLISHHPRIMKIDNMTGKYTEDVMDFWRPNYRKTALVDGKFSTQMYLKALEGAWSDYQAQEGRAYDEFAHFCYHLPFSKMGIKAHQYLTRLNKQTMQAEHIDAAMIYNRIIGNSYSAALYLGLASLLDHRNDLEEQAVAMFSYGSGCVGEFFSGIIQTNYQQYLYTTEHQRLLAKRQALDYETYLEFWHYPEPTDGQTITIDQHNHSTFRLASISNHQRHYART
ncbi:MAG: hydroxymethylglutaryl-CoA synthase [Cardiobacteriales bacterium]|nr:MAG: hydroxymethylglutaryl-CoA synthase [Cardiobacteriales bacterium]